MVEGKQGPLGVVASLNVLLLLGVMLLNGCSVGVNALRRDGMDYSQAVQYTTDQQLLLNIVRLRYRDNPSFLDVCNIATSYTWSRTASMSMTVNDSADLHSFDLRSLLPSFSSGVEEKPTISYVPVRGEKFARQMLTPVSLETVLLLYHSGWSVSRLFRCCLLQFNHLPNAPSASGPTAEQAPEYEGFVQAARSLRRLQMKNHLTLVRGITEGSVELHISSESAQSADAVTFRRLLNLTPDSLEFPLTMSVKGERDPNTIAIRTRSAMGVLYYLSHGVEVTEKDFSLGHVTNTRYPDGTPFQWKKVMDGIFHIRGGQPTPESLWVRHRGRTFFIDASDLTTKSTFMMLTQLLALQSNGSTGAPILTIPVR